MSKIRPKESFKDILERQGFSTELCIVTGTIGVTCYNRRGKQKWTDLSKNVIVNSGKNYLLNAAFAGVTPITDWYIGLINNTPTPTLAVTNTMSSGTRNWAEITSDYDESSRPSWNVTTTSAQTMTNSSTADFTFNGSITVYGIFITSDSSKGGESGTLWSAGAFSSARSVINGDVLKVTYTASM